MIRPLFCLVAALLLSGIASAQTTKPSQAQVQAAMSDPSIRARITAQIKASGKSPEEIRRQLRDMGYSDEVISQILGGPGVDTSKALTEDVFGAVRALGIMDSTGVDSLRTSFVQRRTMRVRADSALLDTLKLAIKDDTVRSAIQRLLRSPSARKSILDSGFNLFGREVFSRRTSQFDAAVNGPLPPDYRIGFGDQFTLVLTGDVERTEDLTVTRDGTAFLRDVGQLSAANLTFDQLRSTLASRLGRVYSGINTGSTRFSILPTRVGMNQIFVFGEVNSPNAYQISRLGTVLTALYAAGGPTDDGDARAVDVRRNNRTIATVDLYDYLMTGGSSGDVRLENGDVVFVRPRGPRVRVTGAVVRPATYELKPGESLADVIRMSGGFAPEADRRRVQIERIVPADQRMLAGADKEVLDITSPLLATGYGPTTQRMEAGDVVHVLTVPTTVVNRIDVTGNVWSPERIALTPGMRLSAALAKAGGLRPDSYLGAVQISRVQPDSSRQMTRVAISPDGMPTDDIELRANDMIRVYSISEFRTERTITVGGAVRKPREILYQEGMTMRDAIMLAGGLKESALLSHAEIARLPDSRIGGVTATTIPVPLDSTYLFERGLDGKYHGPPGVAVPTSRAPETVLQPYDVVSVLQQPDFEYQRTVWITGRVKFAAKYSLKTKTERLSDLIDRAGGLASDAYPAGIVFVRQRDSIGRIGVDLPSVLKNPSSIDNLILVDNDSIFIPPYNAIVTVRGEVNSPAAAVAYVRGADIDYYIRSAGGATAKGDDGHAYVLQPNGKVETKHRVGLLVPSRPDPQAGSVVTVPLRDTTRHVDWVAAVQTSLSLMGSLITIAYLIKR